MAAMMAAMPALSRWICISTASVAQTQGASGWANGGSTAYRRLLWRLLWRL